MTTNSPTQMLEDEHLVIAKVFGAAPVLADRLEAGQLVDVETLLGVVEFMRTFADKCQHGKEEELLFPALAKKRMIRHVVGIARLNPTSDSKNQIVIFVSGFATLVGGDIH